MGGEKNKTRGTRKGVKEVKAVDGTNVYKVVHCTLPFFVIGAGTLATGTPFAGFLMFYLIN